MTLLGYGALVLLVACGMEAVAWFTHKYVMHGFLWVLHADHHHPKGRGLQKNDLFTLFFASPAIILIALGTLVAPSALLVSIGAGITLYGIGYFLFHDIMFHRRIRSLRLRPKGRYFQGIINAHKVHHRHNGKENGVSFGFLYAPKRYAEQPL